MSTYDSEVVLMVGIIDDHRSKRVTYRAVATLEKLGPVPHSVYFCVVSLPTVRRLFLLYRTGD